MPTFTYQARTSKGEIQTGIIEAGSHDAAVLLLQRHGLFITALQEVKAKSFFTQGFRIPRRITRKEVVAFTRQIAVLFEARVPLVESLRTLAQQSHNQSFVLQISALASDVDAGRSFSDALGEFPKTFSTFYVHMVKSGEASGRLQESLTYLADHLEREYALLSRIRGAFIYPAFVFVVFVIVSVAIIVFIIPKLQAVFEESDASLPFLTQLLLGFAGIVRRFGIFAVLALGAGAVGLWQYIRTPKGREWWDAFILRIPIFGDLLRNIFVTRFADNLGTLVTAGLPITQAIHIAQEVVGNHSFAVMLADAEEAVRKGEMIHTAVRGRWFIPPMVAEMISVGEKSGKLDVILGHIARFFGREVDIAVEGIVSLIEPILIVSLGLMVAFLVAAILLPIYNLAGTID